MKTITMYLQNLADIDYRPGYKVYLIDPNEGIDFKDRTIGSGFAEPYAVRVDGEAEVLVDGGGREQLWIGKVCYDAVYMVVKDQIALVPAMMGLKEAIKHNAVIFTKSISLI